MSLVSLNLPSDGSTADASDVNTPFQQIAAVINGNIDSTNIADNSITTAKLSTTLGTALAGGYIPLNYTPDTVTYNGNRSYTLTFNSNDLTGALSPGMRLRTTRTVAAPTQCTTLNGTNQYWSKTSPAGMTFTDDFVVSAWVKLSSYQAGFIISRYNGTSGWRLEIQSDGTVQMRAANGASTNFSAIASYQSIPLNKWVHITAQLDMSAYTVSPTTSYIMIDGVDVPAQVTRGGTNPTALIQAGNLEVGGYGGGSQFFPGKIAQAFITSTKVTQANIRTIYSQGITSTDITNLSIISAYSFNNSINDLNTTNANNLTANGSAVATNADSPFGGQAGGTISSTLDYGIVQSVSFSTNTTVIVQVPEGCTIPTSGGITSVSYSSARAPYGFPGQRGKWQVEVHILSDISYGSGTAGTWSNTPGLNINVPLGEWDLGYDVGINCAHAGTTFLSSYMTLSTTTSTDSDPRFRSTPSNIAVSSTSWDMVAKRNNPVSLTTATPYYLNAKPVVTSTTTKVNGASDAPGIIRAENAYL